MKYIATMIATVAITGFGSGSASLTAQDRTSDQNPPPAAEQDKVPEALDFTVKSIKGDDVNLADYRGKVVIVVNVASRCGYTRQYEDLQKLFAEHADEGLVVLGFPCNQFGGQEPGSEAEILQFCSSKYNVTFDMFSKVEVKGDGACPLYRYLTRLDTQPRGAGDVAWNFEKFVINRDGKVVGRFATKTELDDETFLQVVKTALDGR
jgi:glutathione peroxidase